MTVSNNIAQNNQQSHLVPDLISDRNTAAACNDDDLRLYADVDVVAQTSFDDNVDLPQNLPGRMTRNGNNHILTAGIPQLHASHPYSNNNFGHPSFTQRSMCPHDPLLSESPTDELDPKAQHQQQALAAPSGVAGAVVGLLVGGPILAAVVGFGSAYAVRKDGAAGDVARALGEVAISVQDKTNEWESKHHVIENTKMAIEETDSAIAISVRDFAVNVWKKAEEMEKRHQLMERGVEGTGRGLEYIASKLQQSISNNETESGQWRESQYQPCPQYESDVKGSDGTFW